MKKNRHELNFYSNFLFSITFVITLIILSGFSSAKNCTSEMFIDIHFSAKDGSGGNIGQSAYQFPNFREGDILFIDNLKVINQGTCTLEEPGIVLKLSTESRNISDSFGSNIIIPINLSAGETYEKKDIGRGEVLDETGQWKISGGPSEYFETQLDSWGFKANGIYLDEVVFRVYSDLELKQLDLNIRSPFMDFIVSIISGIIVTVISSIGFYYFHKRHKKRRNISSSN